MLFTPLKKSDVSVERAFRDAPEIPERAGRMMDRVMGGMGRGFEEDLGDVFADHRPIAGVGKLSPTTRREVKGAGTDDADIYDKLGWNDDDFDL